MSRIIAARKLDPEKLLINTNSRMPLRSAPRIPWANDSLGVIRDSRIRAALHGVIRWIAEGSTMDIPEGVRESDLQHCDGMFELLEIMQSRCPTFIKRVNKRVVEIMTYMHDFPETLTGDLSSMVTDPERLRRKHRSESLAFIFLTQNLAEPARSELRSIYSRYEERKPGDIEALLTKYLDVVQGNGFALDYFLYDTISDPEKRDKHLINKITDMVEWGSKLALSVREGRERTEIYRFTAYNIHKFEEQNYTPYVSHAIHEYALLTNQKG